MSGAPTPSRDTRRRLLTLETQAAELARAIERLQSTAANMAPPRFIRIAKTTATGTYPARPSNTYEILFCDDQSTFPQSDGDQAPTWTDHLNAPQAYAHALDGRYYPEDARVFVMTANRQYWLIGGEAEADRVTGQLVGALATSDSTISIDNLAGIDGSAPIASSITAYNTHSWEGDDNALVRVEWNRDTGHWELYQVTCKS